MNFMGVSEKWASRHQKSRQRNWRSFAVGSGRKPANACSPRGVSRGLVNFCTKCTAKDCTSQLPLIAQQTCGKSAHPKRYNLPFWMIIVYKTCQFLVSHGKSWGMCPLMPFALCVVWALKDMIRSPKWIHRCGFPQMLFWRYDSTLSDFQLEIQIIVQMFFFCLPYIIFIIYGGFHNWGYP